MDGSACLFNMHQYGCLITVCTYQGDIWMDGHINSGGQLVVDSHAPQIMQDEVKIMIYAISYIYN
jgi:hypothetical protein